MSFDAKVVKELLKNGKTREEIAQILGISLWNARKLIKQAKELLVAEIPHNAVQSELIAAKLKTEKADIEAKYKTLLAEFENAKEYWENVNELASCIQKSKPTKFAVKTDGRRSISTAVMVASDWHTEETVIKNHVNELNEYNLDIAKKRAENFFGNGLKLVEMCRSRSNIDTLILALLGDFITGYIHDELVESNSLSPIRASLLVYELLVAGIDFIIENGKFQRIIIPTCQGNHGRTTDKPRISTYADNSFEFLIYSFLLKHYANHPIVSVKLTNGYFNTLEVYNRLIRFHHGDGIKYHGGIGGIHIPLRKAIAQWNKAQPAYLDILGHWHSRTSSQDYVVNGSLIGYNDFAIKIKADYEVPQQSFFLIHPKYGKTVEAPILVM